MTRQSWWGGWLLVLTGLVGAAWQGVARAQIGVAGPDGWVSTAQREAIAPRFGTTDAVAGLPDAAYVLTARGTGAESVDGQWIKDVAVKAGQWYHFSVPYSARGVATELRSVLARVCWFDAAGKKVGQPEYPATIRADQPGKPSIIEGTYRAPEGAATARLELHLRWAPDGVVAWGPATFAETGPLAARKVTLAAVNHRPQKSESPEANVAAYAALVDRAGELGADIVCLPEGITKVGSNRTTLELAEPIPGPSTEALGAAAARNHLYIVAGIYELAGDVLHNTAVLIGPRGDLLGTYRKVCLPREEIEGGITPGHDLPVFQAGACTLGMMICWDVHFPEVARGLAEQGAEVILLPIWGGNEILAQARAVENQLYLVASGFDFPTTIYDRDGSTLARATSDPEVITAEVDLNQPMQWKWLGDWRGRIWREAPDLTTDGADSQK